ncbi:hypothetical protein [Thalassospira xiamenensis]|uniref:hypothetical protein n=1 Tax=Thalassospira xiamenensis TaxID=220697 RepID=UPI002000314E|nr:hypothetical protein [Thalassospira xiamenensis]MCK2165950.1 hypothetical protein [Thalassospira xiamenensis]
MYRQLDHYLMARLKKTTRIWLAVYPTVLVFLTIFGDALKEFPFPLGVLVSTLVVVIIVSNFTDPLVGKVFCYLGRTFHKPGLHSKAAPMANNTAPVERSAPSDN